MTSSRRQILKDIFSLGSVQYISQAVSTIVALTTANIVGPEKIGIWAAISVILPFTIYSDLGVIAGAAWRIPFLRGEGRTEDLEKVRSDSFLSTTATTLLVSSAVMFYIFFLSEKKGILFLLGYICLSLMILAHQLNGYYNAVLRADYRFNIIVRSKYLSTFSSVFVLLPLCLIYDIYGLIIGYTIAAWIPVSYFFIKGEYKYFFQLDLKNVYLIARIGIPITLVGFFNITMTNIDKILVVKYMPYNEIGYYKLAATLSGLLLLVSGSIAYVFSPHMLEKYGQSHDPRKLESLVVLPSLVIAYFMSLIIGILYIMIPSLISILLPDFYPAARTAQLLIFSLFFIAVATLSGTFLVNIEKSGHVMIAQWVTIALIFFVGPYILPRGGLEGMALILSGTYFLYSILIIWLSLDAMGFFRKDFLKFTVGVFSPLLYTLAVLAFLTFLSLWFKIKPDKNIIHALLLTVVFTLIFLPGPILAYNKNPRLKEMLKGVFKDGRAAQG